MRASSGEPLLVGHAMNDGESSPSWEAASAAETDAAACRRSDGTASGALPPKELHHMLPVLRPEMSCLGDILPKRAGITGGALPLRLSLIRTLGQWESWARARHR